VVSKTIGVQSIAGNRCVGAPSSETVRGAEALFRNDNVIYAQIRNVLVSIAEKLIEELEKDPKARRRIAELMVTDSDVRLAIVNAVLADVATKRDIERLESATKRDLERLEASTKRELEKLEAATKRDLENLRVEMKAEMERLEERLRSEIQREVRRLEERISALESRMSALENRVNSIEARLARLEGQMNLFVRLFIAFNLPTLIAVIGILLRLVFA